MEQTDKWRYLSVLSRKTLSDDRRMALQFMTYAKQTEALVDFLVDYSQIYSYEPGIKCLNCSALLEVENLYCDEFCKDQAKFVRYVRACQADRRIFKIDIQEAIGVRLLQLNGGGYPEQERLLPPGLRQTIFARDGGKCVLCGKDATEIDHIKGSSSDPSNLRALCGRCNRKKAFGGARPADPEDRAFIEELWEDLAIRVVAPTPVRVCDDADGWKHRWRALKARANQVKRDRNT